MILEIGLKMIETDALVWLALGSSLIIMSDQNPKTLKGIVSFFGSVLCLVSYFLRILG